MKETVRKNKEENPSQKEKHMKEKKKTQNVNINDISYLLNKSNIKYIFVTGKKALYIYNKYLLNITKKEAFYLPSPSSANASYNLKDLTEKYKIILDYLNL